MTDEIKVVEGQLYRYYIHLKGDRIKFLKMEKK